MARIPGRSAWLAWPVGLLCAAVVVALVWLSIPMVPATVAWAGEMLRTATSGPAASPTEAARASTLETAESDADLDCRRFYPADLWTELTWSPRGLLVQDFSAPSTTVTTLTEALAPQVRVSCRWTFHDGATATSTLARVAPDAAPVAEATLQANGFTCATSGTVLSCTRTQAGVVEENAFSGDLWLSSSTTGAVPESYSTRLAAGLWNAG